MNGRTIRVGDVSLYCREYGSRGLPIVCIPGMSLDGSIWEEVAEYLGRNHRVVAAELRGSGRSDVPPGPYSVPMLAGDYYGLLSDLGWERAVFVGHSMGGYVALQMALESPDLVAGIALVGSAAFGDLKRLGASERARVSQLRTRGKLEEIVHDNLTTNVGSRAWFERRDALAQFAAHRVAHPPRGRGVMAQRAAAEAFDVGDRLWELGCPTLVIHGSEDELIPPQRGRDLASSVEGARFELLDDVGHLPPLEVPERLGALLANFAAGLEQGDR